MYYKYYTYIIGIKPYYGYQVISFELAHFKSLSLADHFDGAELVSGACLDVEVLGAGDSMNQVRNFSVYKSTRSSIWRCSIDVHVMVGESLSLTISRPFHHVVSISFQTEHTHWT